MLFPFLNYVLVTSPIIDCPERARTAQIDEGQVKEVHRHSADYQLSEPEKYTLDTERNKETQEGNRYKSILRRHIAFTQTCHCS